MEILVKNDGQYGRYESLLLERDRIRKEAGQIWTAYLREFGQLRILIYEEEVACIRCRKTLAYFQAAANRGEKVDRAVVDAAVEKEMEEYSRGLAGMVEETEAAEAARLSSSRDVQKSKDLYRKLAKRIHPDINGLTEKEPVLMELWVRISAAYGASDVEELEDLEVLAECALSRLGKDMMPVEISDMDARIREMEGEISSIIASKPYTYRHVIRDDAALAAEKAALERELERYRDYRRELDRMIASMIENGEVDLKWKIN